MKRGLELRKKFSDAFSIEVNDFPSVLSEEQYTLNHKLIEEENNEYLEACENEDLAEIADAIGDQLYILYGQILSHGLQDIIEDVFVEIHKSNMSKLDKDGKPIINGENGITDDSKPMGKVLKGDGYFPPNIDGILQKKFEDNLTEKFLDDELKELIDKQYETRDEHLRAILEEKLSKADFKKFQKFEELADYFKDKVRLKQERVSFDQTKFGVEVNGEDFWIHEKVADEF